MVFLFDRLEKIILDLINYSLSEYVIDSLRASPLMGSKTKSKARDFHTVFDFV